MVEICAESREIMGAIALDRDRLARQFGFSCQAWESSGRGGQKSMQIVRALVHAISSPHHAASSVIGRLVPSLTSGHQLQKLSGYSNLTAAYKRTLWHVNQPLTAALHTRLLKRRDLVRILASQPQQLRAVALDPTDVVHWNIETTELIDACLGIEHWSMQPESWQRWFNFVSNDKVIHAKLVACAATLLADRGRGGRQYMDDAIAETKLEMYLAGLNSAASRQRSSSHDLRAELFTHSMKTTMIRALNHMQGQLRVFKAEWTSVRDKSTDQRTQTSELEVGELIGKLPDLERSVVELKLNAVSNSEIALLLKIPPSRVQPLALRAARQMGLAAPKRRHKVSLR